MDLTDFDIVIDQCWFMDWDFILELRNTFSEHFIQQHEISKEEHYEFMKKHQENYFILDVKIKNGEWKKAGFVGVVYNDIRFAVHPDFQKMGLGTKLLKFIKERYPSATARVKLENNASALTFQKAGFVLERVDTQFCYYISSHE